MAKSMIFFILLMPLLLMPAVMSLTVDIPNTFDGSSIGWQSSGNFVVTVTGYNVSGTLTVYAWHNGTRCPYYENQSCTSNGIYYFPYSFADFPYDDINYKLYAEFTSPSYATSDNEDFSVGEDKCYSNYLLLTEPDPKHLELFGGRACGQGQKFKVKSLEPVQISVYITDITPAQHKVTGHGKRNIEFVGEYELSGFDIGQVFRNYTLSRDAFSARTSYFVYFLINSTYYGDVAFFADDDFSGDISTGLPINVSLDADGSDATKLKTDHSLARDYYGYFTYFETFPKEGDLLSGWVAPGTPTTPVSTSVKDFFEDLGFGWGYFLIGLLFPVIIVGVVYRFARTYKISIPNFIYSILIIAGSILAFMVGLMDFWMTGFISLIMVFMLIYTYREALNESYKLGHKFVIGKKIVSRETEALTGKARYLLRRPATDAGIISEPLYRWKPEGKRLRYQPTYEGIKLQEPSYSQHELDQFKKERHERQKKWDEMIKRQERLEKNIPPVTGYKKSRRGR
jgi:hypothetical protein